MNREACAGAMLMLVLTAWPSKACWSAQACGDSLVLAEEGTASSGGTHASVPAPVTVTLPDEAPHLTPVIEDVPRAHARDASSAVVLPDEAPHLTPVTEGPAATESQGK